MEVSARDLDHEELITVNWKHLALHSTHSASTGAGLTKCICQRWEGAFQNLWQLLFSYIVSSEL